MDKRDCLGCTEDFYNDKNPLGVKECWLFKDAKVITRYRIGMWDGMGERRHYHKEKRPNCYRVKGAVFVKAIPDYAK